MIEVPMPRLSDSMEEGTILAWLVESGAQVKRGDEIVEIETDKASMVFEAIAGGYLQILEEAGTTVVVGAPIALLVEDPAELGAAPEKPLKETASEPEGTPVHSAAFNREPGKKPNVSPVALRRAAQLRIDLDRVVGTGPNGRILRKDVDSAAAAATSTSARPTNGDPSDAAKSEESVKGAVTVEELGRTQQMIARRMAESMATVPHFTVTTDIDMENAVTLREELKAVATDVPSFNDLVVKASALALREHPRANGAYRDGRFELYTRINVGVAVAGHKSLMVPIILDADRRTLVEIASLTKLLAQRVRSSEITPPELSGGTFTVSNLGMFGVTQFTAVINPPQAAILAVGAITRRPVEYNGELAIRFSMSVTLSCDHRILYGAEAAAFVARIRELLEEPAVLAEGVW